MRRRGAPKRRLGVLRHPGGRIVRTGALSADSTDAARAKGTDSREGSQAGLLELAGKISRFERLAGEKWAEIVNEYSMRVLDSPNPNPKASNPLLSSGKSPECDPFHLPPDQQRKIDEAKQRFHKAARAFNGLPNRLTVVDKIFDLFILNKKLRADELALARTGLRPLIMELGLTGRQDGGNTPVFMRGLQQK